MKFLLLFCLLSFSTFSQEKLNKQQIEEKIMQEIKILESQNLQNNDRINALIGLLTNYKKDTINNPFDDRYITESLKFSNQVLKNLPDVSNVFTKIKKNDNFDKLQNTIIGIMKKFQKEFEDEIKKLPKTKKY